MFYSEGGEALASEAQSGPVPFVEIPVFAGMGDHRGGPKDRQLILGQLHFEPLIGMDEGAVMTVRRGRGVA
jgi:hypothetical protein